MYMYIYIYIYKYKYKYKYKYFIYYGLGQHPEGFVRSTFVFDLWQCAPTTC